VRREVWRGGLSSSTAGLDFCSSGWTAGSPRGGPFAWYHLLGGRWMRWMPLPAATTRSGVLEVYERRPRGLRTLTELRGLDPKGFGLWRWVLDRWIPRALGVGPPGRWVRGRVTPGALGVGPPGRWVLWGDDDEVSGRDTLRGVSVRRSEAPLTLASRSVGVRVFWALGARALDPQGVGSPGRWVGGRVTPGTPYRRRGHFTGTSMARLEAPIEHSTTV
jgi:hypothetical protein